MHVEFLAMGNSGKNNQKNLSSQQSRRHLTLVFLFVWPQGQVAVAHKWTQLTMRWRMSFLPHLFTIHSLHQYLNGTNRDYKSILQSKLYLKIPFRKLWRSLVGQRPALNCLPMQRSILYRQLCTHLPLLWPWRSAQLLILGLEAFLCFGND